MKGVTVRSDPAVVGAARPAFSPYPGLAPFSTDEKSYFFGREEESRILKANLFASQFTVIHGPSGVGKSSLLNAGLLPRIDEQDDVLAVVFRQWLGNPAKQLQKAIRRRARQVDDGWESDTKDLLETCRHAAERTSRYVMLILDQFEEYFLYNRPGSPFEQSLAALLADDALPVRVLVSIREDSFARLDRFDGLVANLFDNVLRLEHLSRRGGADAIEKPLAQYQRDTGQVVSVEPALVAMVLDGVRAGRIVLSPRGGGVVRSDDDRIEVAYLQLVMERLWSKEMGDRSSTLQASTLTGLGGVESAVRSRFTELMGGLTYDEQILAAKLFYYLVTPSQTKIAWKPTDLAIYAGVDETAARALLATLSEPAYRVLRTGETLGDNGTDVVFEIYHDILARAVAEWRADFQVQEEIRRSKVDERIAWEEAAAAEPVYLPKPLGDADGLVQDDGTAVLPDAPEQDTR